MTHAMTRLPVPGDLISTSYGTGPYVVLDVRPTPSGASLTLKEPGPRKPHAAHNFYINAVRIEKGVCLSLARDHLHLLTAAHEATQPRLF